MKHSKEEMLHRNVFIAELFRLVLCSYQHLVQCIADIGLHAIPGYLRKIVHRLLRSCRERGRVDLHLFHQLGYKAVLHGQETVQKMLLLNLLIAIFHGHVLGVLDGFH